MRGGDGAANYSSTVRSTRRLTGSLGYDTVGENYSYCHLETPYYIWLDVDAFLCCFHSTEICSTVGVNSVSRGSRRTWRGDCSESHDVEVEQAVSLVRREVHIALWE